MILSGLLACGLAETLSVQCSAPERMKSLVDFLNRGVKWGGVVPARQGYSEIDELAGVMFGERAVKVILLHMAGRLNATRADKGLKLGRSSLANMTYSQSTVSAVLARLVRAGVVARLRAGRKGSQHEEIAKTIFNPVIIEQAREWQARHQTNLAKGLRGAAADPAYVLVETPLIWTDRERNL